jgi:hypothetical protein
MTDLSLMDDLLESILAELLDDGNLLSAESTVEAGDVTAPASIFSDSGVSSESSADVLPPIQ